MSHEPKKMVVKKNGRKYWAILERYGNKPRISFWSDHKWPFYHAHYTPDVIDPVDVWEKFEAFIPKFKGEGK